LSLGTAGEATRGVPGSENIPTTIPDEARTGGQGPENGVNFGIWGDKSYGTLWVALFCLVGERGGACSRYARVPWRVGIVGRSRRGRIRRMPRRRQPMTSYWTNSKARLDPRATRQCLAGDRAGRQA